jgi:hypothetical protein
LSGQPLHDAQLIAVVGLAEPVAEVAEQFQRAAPYRGFFALVM